MTLTEFLTKYNGKYVEAGGSANALNQCVDLANQYIEEVLGQPKILWTNAIDFPKKADKNVYDYIANTPDNIPQPGDLVIWGGTTWGHIAIFIEGNVNSFRSLDQNYPTGSPAHVQNHTYKNVLGWLRVKTVSTPSVPDHSNCVSKEQYQTLVESSKNLALERGEFYQQSVEKSELIVKLNDQIKRLEEQNGILLEDASFGQILKNWLGKLVNLWTNLR